MNPVITFLYFLQFLFEGNQFWRDSFWWDFFWQPREGKHNIDVKAKTQSCEPCHVSLVFGYNPITPYRGVFLIHRFFFLTCIWQIKRCTELDWLWMKSSRNSQWCKTVFRWLIRRLHLRRISIRNRNTSRRVVFGHEKVPNRWKMPKPQQLQNSIKN